MVLEVREFDGDAVEEEDAVRHDAEALAQEDDEDVEDASDPHHHQGLADRETQEVDDRGPVVHAARAPDRLGEGAAQHGEAARGAQVLEGAQALDGHRGHRRRAGRRVARDRRAPAPEDANHRERQQTRCDEGQAEGRIQSDGDPEEQRRGRDGSECRDQAVHPEGRVLDLTDEQVRNGPEALLLYGGDVHAAEGVEDAQAHLFASAVEDPGPVHTDREEGEPLQCEESDQEEEQALDRPGLGPATDRSGHPSDGLGLLARGREAHEDRDEEQDPETLEGRAEQSQRPDRVEVTADRSVREGDVLAHLAEAALHDRASRANRCPNSKLRTPSSRAPARPSVRMGP